MAGDQHSSSSQKGDNVLNLLLSGGEDRSAAPHLIAEGSLWRAKNFYYPRGSRSPRTRPAARVFTTSPCPGPITGLHVLQMEDTIQYAITCLDAPRASATCQKLYRINKGTKVPHLRAADIGGDLTPPAMVTFHGRLVVAVKGEPLAVWNGSIASTDAAHAEALLTFGGVPTAGDMITIGEQTWTWQTERVQPTEAQIGGTAAECAQNLATAINQDSWQIDADAGYNDVPWNVRIVCTWGGADGNDIEIDNQTTNLTVQGSLTALAGGADGNSYDPIETYDAPVGAYILCLDRNGRLVAAGDTEEPDVLFFSAPGNEMSWASEPYGAGEYWEIGFGEGNRFTAVAPWGEELWVHKGGQNREIKRLRVADPDPASWDLQVKAFESVNAAIAARAALTASGRHVVLDEGFLGIYQGTDAYDEVRAGSQGQVIWDAIKGAVDDTAFMVVNPVELYAIIFPREGTDAIVFHIDGSDRWAEWQFNLGAGVKITSACYAENLGTILLGASDGHVYKLTDDEDADQGGTFTSSVITAALGGTGLSEVVLKQTMVDYQNLSSGTGTVKLIKNRDEVNPLTLFQFTLIDASMSLYEGNNHDYSEGLEYFNAYYGRAGCDYQAAAEMLAVMVTFTNGRVQLNNVLLRVAGIGRSAQ